jgi:hypothetical protein
MVTTVNGSFALFLSILTAKNTEKNMLRCNPVFLEKTANCSYTHTTPDTTEYRGFLDFLS